jgi:hypothetical protein
VLAYFQRDAIDEQFLHRVRHEESHHRDIEIGSSGDQRPFCGGKDPNTCAAQARLDVRLQLLPREAGVFKVRTELGNEHLHAPEASECRACVLVI